MSTGKNKVVKLAELVDIEQVFSRIMGALGYTTIQEFADLVGCTAQAAYNYKRGDRDIPWSVIFAAMAKSGKITLKSRVIFFALFLNNLLNFYCAKETDCLKRSHQEQTTTGPTMNTSATADQIIADINRNRVALGFGFLPIEREEAAVEERQYWVRYKGGPNGWKWALPIIRKAFADRSNVEMLDIVDTWEEDFHMTLADFDRLEPEIFAWVVAHARAYGKLKF